MFYFFFSVRPETHALHESVNISIDISRSVRWNRRRDFERQTRPGKSEESAKIFNLNVARNVCGRVDSSRENPEVPTTRARCRIGEAVVLGSFARLRRQTQSKRSQRERGRERERAGSRIKHRHDSPLRAILERRHFLTKRHRLVRSRARSTKRTSAPCALCFSPRPEIMENN